jgi:hypothetical protein
MLIKDDVPGIGGVFDISHIKGARGVFSFSDAQKKAILDEGGTEALIHHYVTKMGGTVVNQFGMHNKLVNTGLAMIINLLKGTPATAIPTLMQLGTGGVPGNLGVRTQNGCITPIVVPTAAGLEEKAFTTTPAIGDNGSTGNKLTFVTAFTATGTKGPNEVSVRAAGPLALCYAPFTSGTVTVGNTDVLTVTYAFTLVP